MVAARQFAESAGATEDLTSRLSIIIEELAANLYDHGGLGVSDVFMLELTATESAISVVLEDSGTPFDPRSAKASRRIPSRGGGAGLKLVRAWASHIEYRSEAGQNRLSLRLARDSGA